MPPSVRKESENRLDKKRPTKSFITSPKKQNQFRSSDATKRSKRYTRADMGRPSTRPIKRGTKLAKKLIEQPKPAEPKKFNIVGVLPVKIDLEKAIDEIESKGSSSEIEELPKESEKYVEHDIDLDLDLEQKYFLDFDTHSDEISLSEEEDYSAKQNQLESELDFFEVLGELPHMDEVSLDLTDDVIVEEQIALETDPIDVKDTGKFLDPITCIRVTSLDATKSIISTPEKSLSLDESKSEETDKEEEDKLPQLSNNDIPQYEDFEEPADGFDNVRPSKKIEDETFKLFLETVQQNEIQVIDRTELAAEDLIIEEENQNVVKHLLNILIDHCVAKAEYIDRDVILRNFLDKNKLMKEIKSKYGLLELERRTLQFLNRKTVSFFKRKGAFRLITADKDDILTMYRNTYHTALSTLDEWLAKEEKTKTDYSTQILDMNYQFEEAKQKSNKEVDKLEHLIKSTFQRKSMVKFQSSVDEHLSKMSAVRKEISQVRLKLLLQQHQFSSLKKRMVKLEDLGNGLTAHDFESLETETSGISKKIEEHDSALKRLHNHYNDDVHKMAHLKEKQKMMRSIIAAQKHYYKDLLQEKRELREYITELKLRRNRYKYEIDYLSYRSGILSKPALMKDYDKTVETTNTLRETNEDLKTTIQELMDKIALLKKMV